jgi:hypothetical protein
MQASARKHMISADDLLQLCEAIAIFMHIFCTPSFGTGQVSFANCTHDFHTQKIVICIFSVAIIEIIRP